MPIHAIFCEFSCDLNTIMSRRRFTAEEALAQILDSDEEDLNDDNYGNSSDFSSEDDSQIDAENSAIADDNDSPPASLKRGRGDDSAISDDDDSPPPPKRGRGDGEPQGAAPANQRGHRGNVSHVLNQNADRLGSSDTDDDTVVLLLMLTHPLLHLVDA